MRRFLLPLALAPLLFSPFTTRAQTAPVPSSSPVSALVEDTRRDTRTTTGTIDVPLELGGKRAARTLTAERNRELAEAELANVTDTSR